MDVKQRFIGLREELKKQRAIIDHLQPFGENEIPTTQLEHRIEMKRSREEISSLKATIDALMTKFRILNELVSKAQDSAHEDSQDEVEALRLENEGLRKENCDLQLCLQESATVVRKCLAEDDNESSSLVARLQKENETLRQILY